ncbi:MAG TPA: DUF5777 family beta-barrel protein [Bryobacteraceae bacterium]|nr:DUF5777 family beta-barrel protein [Bryobacteraceae bacterium]
MTGRTLLLMFAASVASWSSQSQASSASPAASPGNASGGAAIFARECAKCHGPDGKGLAEFKTPNFTDPKVQARLTDEQIVTTIKNGKKGTLMPAWSKKLSSSEILLVAAFVRSLGTAQPAPEGSNSKDARTSDAQTSYDPGDDVLLSLPTGRPLDRHGFYVNFTHRFAYDAAFSGTARGGALSGLEGFSLSSFGFRYGVSDRFSVSIFRSPTFTARPIQLMLAYNFFSEQNNAPVNAAVRFSTEGQNNFSRNFTHNIEVIVSRSIGTRAQLYAVPTVSLNNHRLFSPNSYRSASIPNLPGYNTFSTGFGGVLDIRPTVAILAEVIPTFANGRPLGIHRPAFGFGIQKKIRRHAFTLGLTNSPGATVSQRSGTRAAFMNDPSADTFKGLVIGFNLTRQLY